MNLVLLFDAFFLNFVFFQLPSKTLLEKLQFCLNSPVIQESRRKHSALGLYGVATAASQHASKSKKLKKKTCEIPLLQMF